MASLVSLRASDKESSSPLMMEIPRRSGDNQVSCRDDNRDDDDYESRQRKDQVDTDPLSIWPQDVKSSSNCTTVESVADISPTQKRESETQFGSSSSSSRSLSRDENNTLVPKEAQNNLIAAQAYIAEALEWCNSISLRCSTHLVTAKKQALEELSAVLSHAPVDDSLNAWSNEAISYQNSAEDVASKIQAAKKVCEIEDSEEVTPIEDAEYLPQQHEDEKSNFHQQRLAPFAKELEDCERIKNKILSGIVLYNHYDPLHLIVLANTTITDGVQYPLLLHSTFHMKRSDCVRAGLIANIMSSLAASPYLQAQLLERFPRNSHAAIRNLDAVTQRLVDIPYVFYYVSGWYELKLGPVSRIAGLSILPSAIVRKLTWRIFQSKAYRGSLEQRAEALTSRDPRMTSTQFAFKDALDRFGPDFAAVVTRSFCSNLFDYNEGKISREEIFTKTAYSAGVYTIATISFYTLYRIVEAVIIRKQMRAAGSYQDFARADLKKAQAFKSTLSALESSSSKSRSLVDSPEEDHLVISAITPLSDARVDSLSHTLKFLDSPVANLMGDPFYRWSFGNDQNAIDSFRVLDALKFLRTILPSLKSADVAEKEQSYKALTTLKNYLITNAGRGDIENGIDDRMPTENAHFVLPTFSTDGHDFIPQNKIDTLIEFFEKFSTPPTSTPSGSLLGAAQHRGYGSVNNNDNNEL